MNPINEYFMSLTATIVATVMILGIIAAIPAYFGLRKYNRELAAKVARLREQNRRELRHDLRTNYSANT